MCLPIKFLQVFVKINCLFFIVAGIVVETSSFYYLGTKVTQAAALQIVIGFLVFILGIIGFMGQKRRNFCCLTLYNGGVLMIGSISIFLTIAIFIFESNIHENLQCSNNVLPQQKTLADQMKVATEQFCKQNCVCQIDSDVEWPSSHYLFDHRIIHSTTSNIINYPQCNGRIILEWSAVDKLKSLETKYQCSGWCSKEFIFYFTDVNNGPPAESCYQYFVEEYDQEVKFAIILYMVLDIAFTANFFLACCLCYQSKNRSSRIYPKIMYELANF
ncbi:hypothetical protein pb186bvf_002749 [Paramecium bursaria]